MIDYLFKKRPRFSRRRIHDVYVVGLAFFAFIFVRVQVVEVAAQTANNNFGSQSNVSRPDRPNGGFANAAQTQDATTSASNETATRTTNEVETRQNPAPREIWSAFFFGRPKRATAKPQFAFSFLQSQPRPFSENAVIDRNANDNRNFFFGSEEYQGFPESNNSAYTEQPTARSLNSNESPEAPSVENTVQSPIPQRQNTVRQRIEELDRFLNEKTNEYVRANRSLPDVRSYYGWNAPNDTVADNDSQGEVSYDTETARINRSKIRQTSAEVPLRERNDNDRYSRLHAIPERPNGLKISDSSYISTEVARLPVAGSLNENPTSSSENQQKNARSPARPRPLRSTPNVGVSRPVPSFTSPQVSDNKRTTPTQPSAINAPKKNQRSVLRSDKDFIAPDDL